MLPQYYEIFIYNNEIAVVEKIDNDIYNYFKDTFEHVYHAKNGDTYPIHQNFDAGIDMLIVDDDHLYELLDDLRDQGFFDTIEFKFIDDFFSGNYKQCWKSFQGVN